MLVENEQVVEYNQGLFKVKEWLPANPEHTAQEAVLQSYFEVNHFLKMPRRTPRQSFSSMKSMPLVVGAETA